MGFDKKWDKEFIFIYKEAGSYNKRLILEFNLRKEKSEYMSENVEDQSILYSIWVPIFLDSGSLKKERDNYKNTSGSGNFVNFKYIVGDLWDCAYHDPVWF